MKKIQKRRNRANPDRECSVNWNPQDPMLFVSGSRPDRFQKARQSGAGFVCIDLEDSVAPQSKHAAREAVFRYLCANRSADNIAIGIRINSLASDEGKRDMEALRRSRIRPGILVVPKIENHDDLKEVCFAQRGYTPLIVGIIESIRALSNMRALVSSCTGGVLFGAADMSRELDVQIDSEILDHIRCELVLSAKIAGVNAIDTPFLDVHDLAGLQRYAQRSRHLGFNGVAAIHPNQIAHIRRVFRPTAAELDYARRAVRAFAKAKQEVCLLDGRLVEKPLVERFRRLIASANQSPQ